ncbi:Protein of unknown function, partial [Gryllus bimaculatus]
MSQELRAQQRRTREAEAQARALQEQLLQLEAAPSDLGEEGGGDVGGGGGDSGDGGDEDDGGSVGDGTESGGGGAGAARARGRAPSRPASAPPIPCGIAPEPVVLVAASPSRRAPPA